jgi:gas vesicle protein
MEGMSDRMKSVMIGALLGAAVGAIFGMIVGDANDSQVAVKRNSLATVSPTDYMKIGISVLTLAREFGSMLKKT